MSDAKTSALPMGHTDHDTVVHGGDGVAHPGDATTIFWRFFGWAMLFALVAFFINAILTISYDWPGLAGVMDAAPLAFVQAGIYAVAIALGWVVTTRNRDATLRYDAKRISDFNLALVRACFFVVL
ncbi:MAG: permease, partial [Pseudomonadota bacterium]